MAPRSEKITTPHQQNQVLAQTKPNLLFKSGMRSRAVIAQLRVDIRDKIGKSAARSVGWG
jgi:hypothetical protein